MLQSDAPGFDFADTGEGPVVLFLPGSYSTVAAWRPVQRLLRPGLRMVTTSLCGYGKSAETRTRQDADIRHEVELVEAVARHVGEPVHLVGHSFGGTVALATALAGKIPVTSLSLFEANPLDIIRNDGGGELYQRTFRMSQEFEGAVQAAQPEAPGLIIDFWGGAGTFAAMPEPVKAYCRGTAQVNVLDWHCDFGFALTSQDCSSLQVPVLLVRGALANDAMKAMTTRLAKTLPLARPFVVEGAGHFLISSHPEACAKLLSSFIDEVLGRPDRSAGHEPSGQVSREEQR